MEASEYESSESCNVVGMKQSEVTQTLYSDKESFSWNSEQSLQSNASCSEPSERHEYSCAEDISAKGSDVPWHCPAGTSSDANSSCVTCEHDVALVSQDDVSLSSVCCIQDTVKSVSFEEAGSTTSEEYVDASLDLAESARDNSLCEHTTNANHIDSIHAACHAESRAVVNEQQISGEVAHDETVDRLTEDVHINTLSYENAVMSELCEQSEMKDACALTTDSCQYKELQQLCRHLQVIAEIAYFAYSPVTA